jgi:methylphosphotriester-DNA--protein-cysteine methyltransferase
VNPTCRGLRRSSRIRTSGAKPDHSTVVANLDEIGVTPTDLARSVPAHFARRLLDDTDLAITDGAVAGFNNIRQFNREMRRVWTVSGLVDGHRHASACG